MVTTDDEFETESDIKWLFLFSRCGIFLDGVVVVSDAVGFTSFSPPVSLQLPKSLSHSSLPSFVLNSTVVAVVRLVECLCSL